MHLRCQSPRLGAAFQQWPTVRPEGKKPHIFLKRVLSVVSHLEYMEGALCNPETRLVDMIFHPQASGEGRGSLAQETFALPHEMKEAPESRTESLVYYKINAHPCAEQLHCLTRGQADRQRHRAMCSSTRLHPLPFLQP